MMPLEAILTIAQIVLDQLGDQLGDTSAMVTLRDNIHALLEGRQSIGHGGRAFADGKERMIVLGVSDTDDVMWRQLHQLERCRQSRRLVDAGREHHYGSLVEDHL